MGFQTAAYDNIFVSPKMVIQIAVCVCFKLLLMLPFLLLYVLFFLLYIGIVNGVRAMNWSIAPLCLCLFLYFYGEVRASMCQFQTAAYVNIFVSPKMLIQVEVCACFQPLLMLTLL